MIEKKVVIDTLTLPGNELDDYFILGGLPCVLSDEFGCEALLIKDDDLLDACIRFQGSGSKGIRIRRRNESLFWHKGVVAATRSI